MSFYLRANKLEIERSKVRKSRQALAAAQRKAKGTPPPSIGVRVSGSVPEWFLRGLERAQRGE